MKYLPATLIAVLTVVLLSPATASSYNFSDSLDSIKSPLLCAEEKGKKKKEGDEEKEPDCE